MKKRNKSIPIADEIIGYYASKTEKELWWWQGELGLELVIWSSEAEARFYLCQYSEGEFYQDFHPIDFGTMVLGLESGQMRYRLTPEAMKRYFQVWRWDMPQLPPIESIDFEEQEMFSLPPD